jgi:hypothetical protein
MFIESAGLRVQAFASAEPMNGVQHRRQLRLTGSRYAKYGDELFADLVGAAEKLGILGRMS